MSQLIRESKQKNVNKRGRKGSFCHMIVENEKCIVENDNTCSDKQVIIAWKSKISLSFLSKMHKHINVLLRECMDKRLHGRPDAWIQ